jgi:DNA modification methylase
VQTVVTSPPYYGLRQYPGGTENDLGREKTIDLYVEHLLMAMREVWRVLRNDGVVFLNIGDSYHGSGRGAGKNGTNDMKMNRLCSGTPLRGQGKAKSLCLIPHRVMIALENDGWIIRNDIIWEKPNAVPDSVEDRCTTSCEHIVVLVKSQKYYWNKEEAREPSVCWEKGSLGGGVTASRKDGKMKTWTMRHSNKAGSSKTEKRLSSGDVLKEDGSVKWHPVGVGPRGDALVADGTHGESTKWSPPIGNVKHQALGKPTLVGHRVPFKPTRNLRDVWSIPTMPHKEKHIAMFPEPLVERCIRIGSKEGDVVLDCFAGSGTTGVVARQLRRNGVLLDISEEYCRLMKNRLTQQPEPFESLPVPENKTEESSGDPILDCEPCLPQPRWTQTIVINQEFTQWSRSDSVSMFHAALCDTPYGLHFMNAQWDDLRQATKNQVHAYLPPGQRMTTVQENIAYQNAARQWGESMLPHLLPGALVFMFGGTRMFEWLSTGMQLAGFEHWETFMWVYAQGFPKAMDIGKAIDKVKGNEREILGRNPNSREDCDTSNTLFKSGTVGKTDFITRGTSGWDGYKTPALKPAWEPILCFRAPRNGMTYAEIATTYGTGALNVDGARIGTGAKKWDRSKGGIWHASEPGEQHSIDNPLGRYPANLILDPESAMMLEAQKIGASRFFYVAKASQSERNAGLDGIEPETTDDGRNIAIDNPFQRGKTLRRNNHPTIKPLDLCRQLASLLLPPTSVAPRRLLVPFAGSGSEMIGGEQAGWDEIVGVEQNPHFCEIAGRRLRYWRMMPPSSRARNDAA